MTTQPRAEYYKKWAAENVEKRREYQREWYEKNKERFREASRRYRLRHPDRVREKNRNQAPARRIARKKHPEWDWKSTLKRALRTFGLTLDDYVDIMDAQGWRCPICGFGKEDEKRRVFRLVVDHDHSTGKFRGLICDNCNRGLGAFHDNTESLFGAVEYLSSRS